MSALAGRVGEDGTGAMWIAPELLERSTPPITACGLPGRTQPVELRFERVHVDDMDLNAPQLAVQVTDREAVAFEWNPATSELHFRATAGSHVFSDLAVPSDGAMDPPHCGSR